MPGLQYPDLRIRVDRLIYFTRFFDTVIVRARGLVVRRKHTPRANLCKLAFPWFI